MIAPKQDAKADLPELLARARKYWDSLSPEEQRRQMDEQRKSWVRAEMAFGDEGTRVVVAAPSPKGCDVELRDRVRATFEKHGLSGFDALETDCAALINQARQPEGAGAASGRLDVARALRDHYEFALKGEYGSGQRYAIAGLLKMAFDEIERLSTPTDNADGLSDDLVAVPRRVFSDFLNNQPGWPDTARRYMAAPAIGRPPAGKDLAGEVERLRAALRFYAGPHPFPNDGPWGLNSDDFGQVAAQALAALGEGE